MVFSIWVIKRVLRAVVVIVVVKLHWGSLPQNRIELNKLFYGAPHESMGAPHPQPVSY